MVKRVIRGILGDAIEGLVPSRAQPRHDHTRDTEDGERRQTNEYLGHIITGRGIKVHMEGVLATGSLCRPDSTRIPSVCYLILMRENSKSVGASRQALNVEF